jgi:hypothetical protein
MEQLKAGFPGSIYMFTLRAVYVITPNGDYSSKKYMKGKVQGVVEVFFGLVLCE